MGERIQDWWNNEELKILVEKFGTTDKAELKKRVHEYLLNQNKNQDIESSFKHHIEKLRCEILQTKKLSDRIKLWNLLKQEGFTLEQFQLMLQDGEVQKPESNFVRTPEAISQQFKSYGKTITHSRKSDEILQEDGTLRCKHCNKEIPMRGFNFQQLDDYRNHVESMHGQLDDDEREVLLRLYPN